MEIAEQISAEFLQEFLNSLISGVMNEEIPEVFPDKTSKIIAEKNMKKFLEETCGWVNS